MKSEKLKPEHKTLLNPYELRPPVICSICGAPLYDKRQTRIWLGKRCCRICAKQEGEQDASSI